MVDMTTQLDPTTYALIKISELISMSPDDREKIRKLLETLYIQGMQSGSEDGNAIFEAKAEEYARIQGWKEPA